MLILMLLMAAAPLWAGQLDNVARSIAQGDAQQVARFFDGSVEITTPLQSGLYSRNQAEMVLKEFFAANPPKGFQIERESACASNPAMRYAIGSYASPQGNFRVYVRVKKQSPDDQGSIQQLKFER